MFRVRRAFPVILAAAGILLAGCGQSSTPSASTTPSGGVAAIVNGHRVPMERYNLLYHLSLQQSGVTRATASSQAMNQIILYELVQEWANSHNIHVTNADITKQMNGDITSAGGRAKFDARLKQLHITEAQYQELLQPNILGQKVEAAMVPAGSAKTPQAKVEHILIATSGHRPKARTDAQAKTLADQVLKMVQNGGNFAALAQQYSDDPGSSSNGGIYQVTPGEMVKPFDYASFHLRLHHPAVIKTQYGYHVIEVLSRGMAPLTSQQLQQKQQATFQAWLQKQMASARVKRLVKAA